MLQPLHWWWSLSKCCPSLFCWQEKPNTGEEDSTSQHWKHTLQKCWAVSTPSRCGEAFWGEGREKKVQRGWNWWKERGLGEKLSYPKETPADALALQDTAVTISSQLYLALPSEYGIVLLLSFPHFYHSWLHPISIYWNSQIPNQTKLLGNNASWHCLWRVHGPLLLLQFFIG